MVRFRWFTIPIQERKYAMDTMASTENNPNDWNNDIK